MNDEPTPAPAKKRGRKPAAPIDSPEESVIQGPAVKEVPYKAIPPKPPHDFARGEKTPAVIRWRRDFHPETMAATYGKWDWKAYLASNPPE